MASYVAKTIAKRPTSMINWHITNFYLSKAIVAKYETHSIHQLYYAIHADVHSANDVSELCKREFNRRCEDLEGREFGLLQKAFQTGKMPQRDVTLPTRFAACIEVGSPSQSK